MSIQKKYQIFVSSTFTDLIAERQSAVEAILKAGHIPAGMELFTSSNKSQWEVIRRWINESDIYMLILGGRYGSIEPESGKSYTQLEYEYAQEIGKPLFAVVMTDEAKKELKATQIETQNPVKLEDFRKTVLDFMSAFFTDTKDIKLAIHESLNDIIRDNQLVGWVRGNSQNENIAEELANLSEDNRKLREENQRLKDSQTQRMPNLVVSINDNNDIKIKYDVSNTEYYKNREQILNIPRHLIHDLEQQKLYSYNEEIRRISNDDIQSFNRYKETIFAYQNLQEIIHIAITNNGNLKATSVRVKLRFPDFVKVFENKYEIENEILALDELALEVIPRPNYNPLIEAEQAYQKRLREEKLPVLKILDQFQGLDKNFIPYALAPRVINGPRLRNLNPNFSTYIEDNEISISQKELIHERKNLYEDFTLVPLQKGVGEIEVYIHCEEYLEGQKFEIPLIVN